MFTTFAFGYVFSFLIIIAAACTRRSDEPAQQATPPPSTEQEKSPNRIIVKETLWNLAIVEIDSVEYLSNSEGGLLKLERK